MTNIQCLERNINRIGFAAVTLLCAATDQPESEASTVEELRAIVLRQTAVLDSALTELQQLSVRIRQAMAERERLHNIAQSN